MALGKAKISKFYEFFLENVYSYIQNYLYFQIKSKQKEDL